MVGIRQLINRVYNAISRVSPVVYLLLYLLLIPVFAAIYTYAPQQAFYAPYAKYESHATADIYAFEQRLMTSFDKAIKGAPRRPGHWRFKPDFNVLLKPGPNADQISITVIVDLTRETARGREDYDNVPFNTVISYHPVLATSEPAQICREVVAPPNDLLLGEDGPAIFHALFHGEGACGSGDFLVLDPEAESRLAQLLQGWMGDASKFSGQYSRLLYFSAITVTTVGFGDIVPISDNSRLLAALEANCGMVLSGLFLNAVGWRIPRTRPDGPPEDRDADKVVAVEPAANSEPA